MYKAVFIDMDGTLLRKDHTVSHVTKETIQRLIQQGILVVPISARPLHGIFPISESIFPESNPIVSLNGGYIFQNNSISFESHVSVEEVTKVHEEIEKAPVSAMYYSQMEWFAQADTAAVKKEQKITPVHIIIQPFTNTVEHWNKLQTGPNKILIAGDPDVILSLEEKLVSLFGTQLNINKSQPRYLEVMSLEASKKKAIEFLIAQYGFDSSEIIAIGDNYNDKSMIEFAGKGVAMGNAPDEIKSIANYVTDTNDNDGVAKALQFFFNLS